MGRARSTTGGPRSCRRVLVWVRVCIGSCLIAILCIAALFLNPDGRLVWYVHVDDVGAVKSALPSQTCTPRVVSRSELQTLLSWQRHSALDASGPGVNAPSWWTASGAACIASDSSVPWLLDSDKGKHYSDASNKGAQLIRIVNSSDQSEAMAWRLRRGRYPLAPLRSWVDSAPTSEHVADSGRVTWSDCEVWLASSVPNLYDVWNDVLLPLQHDLLAAAEEATTVKGQPPRAADGVHVVLLPTADGAVDTSRRSTSNKTGREEAMQALLSGLGATDSTLLDVRSSGSGAAVDVRYSCFRASRWYGAAAVLSLSSGSRIVRGDADRQRASLALKQRLAARWRLLPYDQDALEALAPLPPWARWVHALVAFVRMPSARLLSMQPDSPWASVGDGGGCRPRALLVLRNASRVLGDADAILAMLTSVGFVAAGIVMESEDRSAAAQAHAGRYADLLVGVHGQGLTWMSLMDGVGSPHCRHVVELRHFGRPLRGVHNVYEMLAADHRLRYLALPPNHVAFDPARIPPHRRQSAMHKLMRQSFPQGLVAFDAQTVYYDLGIMRRVLRHVYGRIKDCVCHGVVPPPPAEWEVELSGVVS